MGSNKFLRLPLYQVDAFTDHVFGGNPAAVVVQTREEREQVSDTTRQAVGLENNLSETAFVAPWAGQPADAAEAAAWELRWFTPQIEVDLCGHATLAAATALWACCGNRHSKLVFHSRSGELAVERPQPGSWADSAEGASLPWLVLDFPAAPPAAEAVQPAAALDSDLVRAAACGERVSEVLLSARLKYLLVVLEETGNVGREALLRLRPSSAALLAAHSDLVGLIVLAAGDAGSSHDGYYRFFAPWAGLDEDPVTGSAAAVIAPYLARRLGRESLSLRQDSRRGGELRVVFEGERVKIAGQSVVTVEGKIIVPTN